MGNLWGKVYMGHLWGKVVNKPLGHLWGKPLGIYILLGIGFMRVYEGLWA
jgi:hypothetical protein